MIEPRDGVVVVVERTGDVASALAESLGGIRVESTTESSTLASLADTVDCVVFGAGPTPISTAVDDARVVGDDVPVVVFRPAAAVSPGTALDAGATDVVPADGPDDIRLLARRVEMAVDHRRRMREHVETTNLLDALFERIPLHLYVKDTDGRHLRVSSAYTTDPDQYVGKTDVELYESEDSAQTYADDMSVIEADEPLLHKREPVVHDDSERFSVGDLRSYYADTTPGEGSILGDRADDCENDERRIDDGDYDGWVLTSKVPWYDADGSIAGLIGVTIDITQEEAYRRLLERQNRRLEEFASVVSHDLRNPLNVAEGYLELARETGNTDYLTRVATAHDRMNELVDDVLTLARGGNDIHEVDDLSLDSLVTEAWKTVDTQEATLDVVDRLGRVRADETRLRELLENLFRNGIEHGERAAGRSASDDAEGSRDDERLASAVTVRVGRLNDGFYVEDDGPGIPEAERERVFDQGVTTSPGGTGFGLAIVRRVADAHGWTVSITDASDSDTGARFEIRGVDDVAGNSSQTE